MKVDYRQIEEAAKELYVRALKVLPPDIKQGFARLAAQETAPIAQRVLTTMIRNIDVAEQTDNLLCQDTGVPIYNVWIGANVEVDGVALKRAIREGCARATVEHPLRSSIVHPLTRKNDQTSCGIEVPVIHVDWSESRDTLEIEMIPKGSGSENNSFLKMAIPAEGVNAIRRAARGRRSRRPASCTDFDRAFRLDAADQRSASARASDQRYGHAAVDIVRTARRNADPPVRSRPPYAVRPARPRGDSHGAQRQTGGTKRRQPGRLRAGMRRHDDVRPDGALHASVDGAVR